MNEDITRQLNEIKQSFRMLMNGETFRSMKEKGMDYRLNWGANTLDLRKKADEIGKDYHLAIALWKENVRECKILATMTMPVNQMEKDLVDLWMEQTEVQEIAEQAVFNLYQHLPFAPSLAYSWIASSREIEQLSGYLLLARVFMKKQIPNERGAEEFIDQALTALQAPEMPVRHAAMNCIRKFADLGEPYEKMAESALKSINLELF